MDSGSFTVRLAKQYQDATHLAVAESLVQRLSSDPLTLAAAARMMIERSKFRTKKSFWSFVPETLQTTEALQDMVAGVCLTLDQDKEAIRGVASYLLQLGGYPSQAKLLRKM